ncbi:MAG: hypothetical protein J2P56_08350 [Verrucomicrobia bacterium]|nr:hypothetical protein [Verrucomicrobiota bacterium]
MVDPNEPKKETTRISFASTEAEKPPDSNSKSRDTVQLPLYEPPVHILPEPAAVVAAQKVVSPQFFRPPEPPPVPLTAAVTPAPDPPPSGPIKETVRIPLRTVQMKKTQPLVALPEVVPQNPAIAVAPLEKNHTPMLWLLLGVSAVILIIQIWTYLS